MIKHNKLAVVAADKGGAVLLVDPDMLQRRTLEKLNNPLLYNKLADDPTHDLHQELFDLWLIGKEGGFVTPQEAQQVMGITHNLKEDGTFTSNKSTSPHFKPGKAYFYPSLKIHKLKKEDLVPGVEPPIRLITALQDGITKRSDVFLASQYLKELEKDFCADLLTDTTDALRWLEFVESEHSADKKKGFRAFTYDFKALYDSLTPSLVIESLKSAMESCRSDWPEDFRSWIIDLVELSLRSAVGLFDNNWFIQLIGIPTGGSLCVQIANIAVYYIMNKCVYSNPELMKKVVSAVRFIDDGTGLFEGSKDEFKMWIADVNKALLSYGLIIDEYQVEDPGSYVSFLDIQFTFDTLGSLQTDLFIKKTDSRSYLHFTSSHPNHIFSGIVYSQCIRLRRIINSKERLQKQLSSLKKAFLAAGYPRKMVENISNKVLNSERSLERKQDISEETTPFLPIRVVSTFGSDEELVSTSKKYEEHLTRTRSFSDSDASQVTSSTPIPIQKRIFQFVKKTGPSLRSRLVKVKQLAMGAQYGPTTKCNVSRCACCALVKGNHEFRINGKKVKAAPGNCLSYNIIYLVQCSICTKAYVGRSTRSLRVRTGEHRTKFYKLLTGANVDETNDEFSLGLHLLDHGFHDRKDFNKVFSVLV